ncbi:hypothetical protein SEPL_334 [Salmonella phage SE_PL]|uniref:hypothetical protein n=1 Tax=Salmonella enterica TaxID=28901 RepID=UPI000FDF8461|nr:hypothetical protein CPT_Munch_089 [Salmonella phage Munch]EAZ2022886.1 hypothetical protein [Salmonella enterica]ECV9084020.1 hypothetical protein [Salmonella enterica subsp. enterica serovar Infantis]MCP0435879.1 hypothetical protein [Salmonella enterica subsp. enterica serovar Mbandaka]QCW18767.1 hypothetical protein 7t3_0246 [Salmonella phage 7t3]QIG62947.1 hypothetical protein SEPL_334 [Salmonella phage SE_PL]WNV47195.1 hypothetical protein [Klebsiella phage fENko-Kae01]
MNEVTYKQKDGTLIKNSNELPQYFTGYKISKDYNKLSSITEFDKGTEIGRISFRPTQQPVIFSVKYGGYSEERYNNGNVNSVYYTDHNARIYGEYRKYTINGELKTVKYFSDSSDVTEDIKSFIGFTGDNDSFKTYKFAEDEVFNLYMMYGSKFKFHDEYRIDSSKFDDIMRFCLK